MDDLTRLKLLTDEIETELRGDADNTGCSDCAAPLPSGRMYTDIQLRMLLEAHQGSVEDTAYDVLLRKAENSGLRLSGGTELPDQRAYWLSRARSVRRNGTRPAARADGT